jgi:DNA repair exonuclease SbcCD nuclease subunit
VTLEAGTERVNFALMPFPTDTRYDIQAEDAGGTARRNERMAKRFIEVAEELRTQAAEQRLPTILLTHVTVQGTSVGPHTISARDDVVVPRGGFPAFELTVVGHIHKPEQVGSAPFYYVGALDRMDVGERDYAPRVLLADVRRDGLRDVTSLPLDPTPFAAVDATSEHDLVEAHAAMERPAETLVKLALQVPFGTHTAPLVERARELFPRLYGSVEHLWEDAETVAPSVEGLNPTDVEGTIRRYLEEQQMPDDERESLLALVGELRAGSAAA